jgi:rhodanese-related sulfurtransferase
MIDLATLKEQFLAGKVVLIDIRERDEWDAGHVTNAIFMPLSSFANLDLVNHIPPNLPHYLYCASGKRAVIAQKMLEPYIPHVIALAEGFTDLKAHGFPTQ